MSKRSPLDCIPSAEAVRSRLNAIIREARQLRILLRTARQIEHEQSRKSSKRGEK